jgi:putative hydrolase of the HAD superfamily
VTVRALMVDVDGVLISHPPGRRWDSDLLADLAIDPDLLQERFFRAHFDEVVLGRADLLERLGLVMPTLGAVAAAELVDYWFAHDAHLDRTLLADLDALPAQGLALHLATVQEHHRARYLWDDLGLRRHFSAMHYAADIGYRKTDPEFYQTVERRTGLLPEQCCLIDDSKRNIETAYIAGWQGALWTYGTRLADLSATWNAKQ